MEAGRVCQDMSSSAVRLNIDCPLVYLNAGTTIQDMSSSGVRFSKENSTHIYDDIAELRKDNRKSIANRISHQYEKLIGLARTKKNRMCVFSVVSFMVALFSLTGAIIFAVFYAKPTFCDKTEGINWMLMCPKSSTGSIIFCPQSSTLVIQEVEITRLSIIGIPCNSNDYCMEKDEAITKNVQAVCNGKMNCTLNNVYFHFLKDRPCTRGYNMLVKFKCINK